MSEPSLEQMLEAELAEGALFIGEVSLVQLTGGALQLTHRSTNSTAGETPMLQNVDFAPEEALEIAKFDDAGNYRPLRTAPNLRHGWTITVPSVADARKVIDAIYPARLAAWSAWKLGRLTMTPLRHTLHRQSGMYRVAAKIADEQIDDLVGNFCRSDGGCLRTILWRRDLDGHVASTKLPSTKFNPAFDQTARAERCIPLLCQEACNLLITACRDVVKQEK